MRGLEDVYVNVSAYVGEVCRCLGMWRNLVCVCPRVNANPSA